MSCETCGMVHRSPWVSAFRTLLQLKLQGLLGISDLTASELHRLRREEIIDGLEMLVPFIDAFLTVPERLPKEIQEGQLRIAFVAGSKLWRPVAERVGQLYELRFVNRCIVSGHQGKLEAPEAELMRNFLIEYGVPEEHMVLERDARNTSENMGKMLSLHAEHYPGQEVLIVGKDYHVARMLAAFFDELQSSPDSRIPAVYLAHTNVYGKNWLSDAEAVEAIVGEVFRHCRYHTQGVWIGCNAKKVYEPLLVSLRNLTQ